MTRVMLIVMTSGTWDLLKTVRTICLSSPRLGFFDRCVSCTVHCWRSWKCDHYDSIEEEIPCSGKVRNPHKIEGLELDKVTSALVWFFGGYKNTFTETGMCIKCQEFFPRFRQDSADLLSDVEKSLSVGVWCNLPHWNLGGVRWCNWKAGHTRVQTASK